MPAPTFNPDRIARYEANGWRAYYEHNWLRLLRLIVATNQAEFHIPFPMSLLAAYYITRASAAWVSTNHDRDAVRRLHEKYYEIVRRYSGLTFDVPRIAALEEQYWEVHRRLSGKPDKTEFVDTMVALHSELFNISPDEARESAALRVAANTTVDEITGKRSTDPEADWRKLEDQLRRCYRSLLDVLQAKAAV